MKLTPEELDRLESRGLQLREDIKTAQDRGVDVYIKWREAFVGGAPDEIVDALWARNQDCAKQLVRTQEAFEACKRQAIAHRDAELREQAEAQGGTFQKVLLDEAGNIIGPAE